MSALTQWADLQDRARAYVVSVHGTLPPPPDGDSDTARWAREAHHWRGMFEQAVALRMLDEEAR